MYLRKRGNLSIIQTDHIKILKDAGLTNLQARVYLGSLLLGQANMLRLSQFTNIDKSNVSKTLKDLEKLELIEKHLGFSTSYKPVSLNNAISILTKRKKQEYTQIIKGFEQLTREINGKENIEVKQEPDFFKILPAGTETFSRNWENSLRKITKSVDLIITEKREIKDEPIWDIYANHLQKGVKVRWLFDRSEKNDQEFILRIKQFEQLLSYPELKIKACFDCSRPFGGILDNKIAVIFLDRGPPLKCVRSLWTNNPEIVQNFREHFDVCWEKSVSCPVKMYSTKTFYKDLIDL